VYAIVDIETTGGHANANGITEVAICLHDGKKVTQRYTTLVNPKRDIPVYIRALTGITNEMVQEAPPFDEVAADIYHLLHGKIFVAHNVNFDYSFIKFHLATAGYDLQCNKLCTVRLGRKIMPGLPSYSLGKLCHYLGIENDSRHRAMGDADATSILFSLLLQKDTGNHVQTMLKQRSKDQVLPPHLPKEDIDKLPYAPGVYYFHDAKGKVIYVGKARNVKKRVCSHFSGNNSGYQRQEFLRNIHHVSYQDCGTELVAFVLEAIEIKRLWPKYNRSLKRYEHAYGIYAFEDQRGYMRLAVDKRRKLAAPLYTCNSLLDGRNILLRLINDFELCPKLCFIQNNHEACTGAMGHVCACEGIENPETYNQKVQWAMDQLRDNLPTFAVRDEGRRNDEHSCILIEKGQFYGMGYVSQDLSVNGLDDLKNHLTPYPGNDYIRNMVSSYAMKYPERTLIFS
jgi:DNA polymerase-3 subunit epsilon